MIAIGTPYNPVLLLWTNMQYENLVQKSLIFPLKFRPSSTFRPIGVFWTHTMLFKIQKQMLNTNK
jgi:hypothetical protein